MKCTSGKSDVKPFKHARSASTKPNIGYSLSCKSRRRLGSPLDRLLPDWQPVTINRLRTLRQLSSALHKPKHTSWKRKPSCIDDRRHMAHGTGYRILELDTPTYVLVLYIYCSHHITLSNRGCPMRCQMDTHWRHSQNKCKIKNLNECENRIISWGYSPEKNWTK